MLNAIHPLPMKEVLSIEYNMEAGATLTSAAYMIQGFSRIVGVLRFVAGGAPAPAVATFQIQQGYQDNAFPAGTFIRWIHTQDIFNIQTAQDIPFDYSIRMKGLRWVLDNTSGQPADFFLSVWLRNE